jgi:hypothetical protein
MNGSGEMSNWIWLDARSASTAAWIRQLDIGDVLVERRGRNP